MIALASKVLRLVLLSLLVVIAVYYALISDRALPDHPLVRGYNDLLLHAGLFALLGLVIFAFRGATLKKLLFLSAIAGVLELGQVATEGRESSILDFLSSLAGVVIALLVVLVARGLFDAMRPRSQHRLQQRTN